MKLKIKIFEADTMQEAVDQLLAEGYLPQTVKQIYDLKEAGLISKDRWYSTSTIYLNGEIRTATLEELKNLDKIYEQKGRVLFVGNVSDGLYGNISLNDIGRFVGVAPEAHTVTKFHVVRFREDEVALLLQGARVGKNVGCMTIIFETVR